MGPDSFRENCNVNSFQLQGIVAFATSVLLATIVLAACTGAAPALPEDTPMATAVTADENGNQEADTTPASETPPDAVQDTDDTQDQPPSDPDDIAGIVNAANTFLGLLDESQRSVAVLPFDDARRANWSNLPAGALRFDRNGVRMGDLDKAQTAAMMDFLTTGLSHDGLHTVMAVVGAEAILAASPRAGQTGWSEDNYWLAFFGPPLTTAPWGWQFGGHHLAVNMTIEVDHITMSPTFIGIEPVTYETDAGTVAPLAAELEAGLALINALETPVQAQAMLPARPRRILTGAGQDGVIPALEGARVAAWNRDQQQALRETAALWVNMLPAHSASLRLAEIESHWPDTYFAWHGPTDGTGTIYYRIQGPTLIIEFSVQGALGHEDGHYHTIYRDPTNEYGQE